MKLSLLASLAAVAQLTSAHYFFELVVYEGKETKPFEFVRESTREPKYNPTKWKNPLDNMTPDMDDFRCNKGSFASAGRTGVLEVKAGAKIGMKLGVQATMRHPGPTAMFMSKAPGSVKEYQGDLEWFKISQGGLCRQGDIKGDAWCSWDKNVVEGVIPEDILDGEYLLRAEHVGLHGAHDGQAEFYFGCAQIKVTGGGNAVPKDTIKFPGGYKKDDPEWNFSVWGGYKEYTFHAPAVYKAGSGGGAQSPVTPSPATPSPASSSVPSATASSSPSASPKPTEPETSQPETQPGTSQPENPQTDYPESEASQPQPAQPAASPSTPAQKPKCNGGKTRRGRRAFRETLRK